MPLFMDVHKGSEFTLEEVKKAHLADLEVQAKYGVRYVQYWVNDADGIVFCLMHGPDKEACANVHREAHGDIACNIIQVEKGDYELLMGITTVDENDIAHNQLGEVDFGYRFFISVSFAGSVKHLIEPEFMAGKIIKEKGGREIIQPEQEIIGVFNCCKQAIDCAQTTHSMVNKFLEKKELKEKIEFRIAVAAGEPVTENDGLFSDTIKFVRRLNELAAKNRILLSSLVKNLYTGSIIQSYSGEGLFKVLTPADEALLTRLMDVTESRLNDQQLSVSSLSREVGLSRPQLYRKMVDLTENSPGDFIRKLRLNKAEKLMRRQDQNIAEIALKVGFSNPSYFSKCFFDRFGALPSQYLETA